MFFIGVSPDRVKIISVEPYLTPNANNQRSMSNILRSRKRYVAMIQVVLRVYGTMMMTRKGLGNHLRSKGIKAIGMNVNVSRGHSVYVKRKNSS